MQLVVDNLLTHYTRTGSGKIVLIIPGWADTSASWTKIQQELGKKYDCIVVDIPGFGGSQAPPVAWGLAEYASFVGKFLQKLNIGKIEVLVGHSNGGSIAIKALQAGTMQANKLILIASAGIREQSRQKFAMKVVAKAGKIVSAPLPANTKEKVRKKFYAAIKSDLLVAEHMQESFKKVVAEDVQAAARTIEPPTLLIYGDQDTETPLSYGQKYHELIGSSQLDVVPGAGHFLHVQNSEELRKSLREFLK